METLTLKDIAGYLPYGLKVESKIAATFKDIFEVTGHINDTFWFTGLSYNGDIMDFKPILNPMSCLTKEISVNGETFIPIVELLKSHINVGKPKNLVWIGDSIVYENLVLMQTKNLYLRPEQFQKLYEWKIDFTGLIERGLAVDATTININPYS